MLSDEEWRHRVSMAGWEGFASGVFVGVMGMTLYIAFFYDVCKVCYGD